MNDSPPEPVAPPAPEKKEEEPPLPPEKPRSSFLRRALLWLIGLLVVFSLGVLAAVLVLYQPASERFAQSQTELDQANQRIAELEAEVERMTPMEEENLEVREQLRDNRMHILILSSLADVNAARLALANEDPARARVLLNNTADELAELSALVDENQQEVVTAMQERLELAQREMERDAFAAQSDLEVLATNLIQLENSFFADP